VSIRIKRLTALKKTKAKTNKELEALGRRHLKDVRVVVKNMVYVVGMGVGQEGRAEEVGPSSLLELALVW
jgi:hypothetical protein